MKGLLTTAALAAALLPAAARADMACGERAGIVAKLDGEFGETRIGMGLGHDGLVVELFASPDSGRWTMLVTFPTGQTCLFGAGEAWQAPPVATAEKPGA